MIPQLKQWFVPSVTAIIHIGSGRERLISNKNFTIGYGAVNTWNLDSDKPHAGLLNFQKTKTGLEVEPGNPGETFLVDGRSWSGETLEPETEYTLQIQDEQFLL